MCGVYCFSSAKNTSKSGQVAPSVSGFYFAYWFCSMGGRAANTRPFGEIRSPTLAGFSACPPLLKTGFLSLCKRSKAMSKAKGTSVPSVFQFDSQEVRIFVDDQSQPWFCATDVCAVLGYQNAPDAIAKHCRKAGIAKRDISSNRQKRELTFINEGNVHRLILKSHKPEAERVADWLCDEVLPAIRKTGRYEAASSEVTKAQLKDAFRNARWLARYRDGELRFESLPSNAFVTTPQEYI